MSDAAVVIGYSKSIPLSPLAFSAVMPGLEISLVIKRGNNLYHSLFIAARIGQPPISAFISRLEVISLLVVPRLRCVERPGVTA